MKYDFDRLVPPGMEGWKLVKNFLTGMAFAVLVSLYFFIDYLDSYRSMYYNDEIVRSMPAFGAMIVNGYMVLFPITALAMLVNVVPYYLYFYTGSKSVYTMRRLGKPLEMHKRCWILPVCLCLTALAVWALMVAVYFLFYMLVSPVEGIRPCEFGEYWIYRDQKMYCRSMADVWYYQLVLLWRGFV